MRAFLDVVIALTRSWAATYTRGLPPDVRAERREEIDCDLWHQQRLADLEREPVTGTAVQILVRIILGIPADLAWRVETGSLLKTERRTGNVNDSLSMRGLLVLALGVAAFPVVIGVLVAAGLNGETSTSERWIFGPIQIVVGAAIIGGLALSTRKPALGIGLVVAGALAISVMYYWAAVIVAPIGVAIAAIAVFRALGAGWPRKADGSPPTGVAAG